MKSLYKYFPLYVALLVLAILITGFFGGVTVRALFFQRISAGLEDTAFMLKNLLVNEEPEGIDSFCKTAGTGFSRITVIDGGGRVLGDSIVDPLEMDNHGDRPEIKKAYLGVVGISIRFSNTLKRTMVYLALPAFSHFGKQIVLRTATPYRALNSELRRAYTQIAAVGGVILVLLSLLGFVLVNRVNGALLIINTAVSEYSKGNLSFRPHVYRPPELKRVADTISAMAGDLLARAAEESRQKNELEAVFSGMDEAVIVLDTDLVIREMNGSAYQLTEFTPGTAIGKEMLLVFRNSALYELAGRAKETGAPVEGDIIFFKDRERYLQIRGSQLTGSLSSRDSRIVLVLNDISRLKKLEQVRKDFVANVSHELKTPITAVKGYVETLLSGDYKDRETSKNFLEIVLRHVNRLTAIIEDLNIISRLEGNNGAKPKIDSCNLHEIIRNVVRTYNAHAKGKNISLTAECPAGELIEANCILLEQAIANLVDNAVKYSGPGGSVEIRTLRRGGTIVIQVEDRGAGIPQEHRDRIFERFYRVDTGRSRELGGTGLGLSIVKHIAISHGGQVHVESTEGGGSVFTLSIPESQPR